MTDDLNELRPRLMSVAYRMPGIVADAEDAVQDAFLQSQTAGGLASPERFLMIQVVSLSLGDGVRAVYMTVNPDKLTRWSVAEIEQDGRAIKFHKRGDSA